MLSNLFWIVTVQDPFQESKESNLKNEKTDFKISFEVMV